MREVGRVVDFLKNPSVAVVELIGSVFEGDRLIFGSRETTVSSMQIQKEPVTEAHAGHAVGIKVPWPVEYNTRVYVTE